jgi:hypothetical protein
MTTATATKTKTTDTVVAKKALDYLEAIDWKLWEMLKILEKETEK